MCLSLCFICGNLRDLRIETRISYTELLHSAVNFLVADDYGNRSLNDHRSTEERRF
jgi:hypothetical protein